MRFITLLNKRFSGGFKRESAAQRSWPRDEGRFAALNPGFPSKLRFPFQCEKKIEMEFHRFYN